MLGKMKRRAEMGVGTLIIFIALLLVAAVAAGVLIQTAGSLQQRALSTGSQATGQISTNAVILEVSATDGQDSAVEEFSAIVKLAPGSDPIKLEDVTFTYSTKDSTQTLLFHNTTFTDGNTTHFGTSYLQTGTNYQAGRLSRGDVLKLTWDSQNNLTEGEEARISLIPKIGTPTQVVFAAPDVMSTQQVYLYP